jgi:hypothetical protein
VKSLCTLLLAVFSFFSVAVAQTAPPARTDVYHINFTKAALGKAAALGDYVKTPNPSNPMPQHFLVLRHQDGAEWDYLTISHLGNSTTLTPAGTPPPPAARDLSEWHGDTYVNGPSWSDFAREMGIGDQTPKTASSVYVVSVYRAAPGHRTELEKMLSAPLTAGATATGNILMMHLEGAPWQYLVIARYNSWHDFATNEINSMADTSKGKGGWFELRDHVAFHQDTITDRLAP